MYSDEQSKAHYEQIHELLTYINNLLPPDDPSYIEPHDLVIYASNLAYGPSPLNSAAAAADDDDEQQYPEELTDDVIKNLWSIQEDAGKGDFSSWKWFLKSKFAGQFPSSSSSSEGNNGEDMSARGTRRVFPEEAAEAVYRPVEEWRKDAAADVVPPEPVPAKDDGSEGVDVRGLFTALKTEVRDTVDALTARINALEARVDELSEKKKTEARADTPPEKQKEETEPAKESLSADETVKNVMNKFGGMKIDKSGDRWELAEQGKSSGSEVLKRLAAKAAESGTTTQTPKAGDEIALRSLLERHGGAGDNGRSTAQGVGITAPTLVSPGGLYSKRGVCERSGEPENTNRTPRTGRPPLKLRPKASTEDDRSAHAVGRWIPETSIPPSSSYSTEAKKNEGSRETGTTSGASPTDNKLSLRTRLEPQGSTEVSRRTTTQNAGTTSATLTSSIISALKKDGQSSQTSPTDDKPSSTSPFEPKRRTADARNPTIATLTSSIFSPASQNDKQTQPQGGIKKSTSPNKLKSTMTIPNYWRDASPDAPDTSAQTETQMQTQTERRGSGGRGRGLERGRGWKGKRGDFGKKD